MRWAGLLALAACLAALVGCDDGGAGRRYRAERDFWQAQREADRLDVNPELVGENELLQLADRFLRVGATYIGVVQAGEVGEATGSDLSVARIGARAKLLAAEYYLRGGDYQSSKKVALELREEVAWSPPASMNAQVALVEALRHTGTPEEVVTEMWRLAERYPAADTTGAKIHNKVFNAPREVVRHVSRTGGDVSEAVARAIGYYDEVRQRWPKSLAALLADLHRSTLYDGRGDWELAASVLELALDTYPETVLVPDQAARVAYTLGRVLSADDRDPVRGVAAFERARAAAPGTDPAWDATLELAEHHSRAKHFDKAIALFREVAEGEDSRQRRAYAMFAVGRVLEAAGRWDEARAQYNSLEATFPQSTEARRVPFVVAAHYRDVGEDELAGTILERVEREVRKTIREGGDGPEIVQAYQYLFDALAGREEWQIALREMEAFAARFPGRAETALVLLQGARISDEELGDQARAAAWLRRVEAEYPNSRFAERAMEMMPELAN